MVDSHQSAQAAGPRPVGKASAITALVARIFLGLIFLLAGTSGFVFLFTSVPPPPPGLAGSFQDVFFRSHWAQFVDGVELIAGVLLLVNRYVPLALTLLGAVIANILVFHLTMQPQTIPLPLVVVIAWGVLAYRYRANLAPLFEERPVVS
jgi:putative oxidoreductase